MYVVQRNDSQTIWKHEYQNHDQAKDQRWNNDDKKANLLETHVHEVSNDQSGLNQRKAHKNDEHDVRLKPQVREEGFNARENQEPKPNPHEQFLRTRLMRSGCRSFMRVHRALRSLPSDSLQID
jgi:hypothetical protein